MVFTAHCAKYSTQTYKTYECYLLIPEVLKDALEVGSWNFVGSEGWSPGCNDFGVLADKVLEKSFSIEIPTLSAITR